MNAPLLKVDDLHIALAGDGATFNAVENVSFEIGRGEAFGLVGESGCGKSITALAVMGLLRRPLSLGKGRIVLDGEEIQDASAAAPARAARQPHRHDLPGADDGAQSAVAGRPPDRRDVRAAPERLVERGDGPRRGRAAPGARALARAAHQGLSRTSFPAACASAS